MDIVIPLATFLLSIQGCVAEKVSLKAEKGLAQDELAYYADSFDDFRKGLWLKTGMTFNKAQLGNFKIANADIADGRLS